MPASCGTCARRPPFANPVPARQAPEATPKSEMDMPVQAVVALLEDVVYPKGHYGEHACRAGAELLHTLLGIDVHDALIAYYVPGAEDLAVRAALEEQFQEIDPRLVAKTAAVMASRAARVAPYEDAQEVFSILHGMGVPLGLIVDGPPRSQRQLVRHLKLDRIFRQMVFSGELRGEQPWVDALGIMELLLDCPLCAMAFVCARGGQAKLVSGKVGQVYRIFRNTPTGHRQSANVGLSHIIPMLNLYDLPEALGLVAWPD